MQHILPGQPQAQLHGVDYGYYEGQLVVAYISGSSVVLLNGPQTVLQTIQTDDSLETELTVLRYHQASGRIAVASKSKVYVYRLREEIKGTLRWVFELSISLDNIDGDIATLSWGSDEELLLGGSKALSLFSATRGQSTRSVEITKAVWSRSIPTPIIYADFSPSASLIATLARCDCLVKVWRRLSFESPQFDFAYLRHPATVTHAEWRRTEEEGDSHIRDDDVLFTICADGKFRVWKSLSPHGIEILSLYAEIDMVATIQPRDPTRRTAGDRRYAFVIQSHSLEEIAKINLGRQAQSENQAKHVQEHLKDITSRKPDIVVIADEHGHMSAWGLESIGCRRRSSGPRIDANPFHINSIENIRFGIMAHAIRTHSNTRLLALRPSESPGEIAILAHHFDGRISWHQALLRDLLDPSAKRHRLRQVTEWTGHLTSIKKVIRTASGKSLISRTDENEGIVWKHDSNGVLKRASTINLHEHIHRVVLLRDGDFLACLHHDKITLWDTRGYYAKEVARCDYSMKEKPLCLLVLPKIGPPNDISFLATISAGMSGQVWKLSLPSSHQVNGHSEHATSIAMEEYCEFQLDALDQALYVLPVDPAGSKAAASDFLDVFAHDVAMSYSAKGTLRTYTARMNEAKQNVDFLTTSTVETGLSDPALGSATSIRRAALVDTTRRRLTIWDTRNGRLDHDESFEDYIQDLDWAATPDGQSILAVGFSRRVQVYSQLRYDYLNERPAWTRIKDVPLPAFNPHPIGDSVWLGNGSLVIGAGNQLYVTADTIDLQKDLNTELQTSIPHSRASQIHQLVRRMNGPLPVFHPQFISQCVLADKLDVVHGVLLKLLQTLRFYTEGDELDPMLGFGVGNFAVLEENDSTLARSQNGLRSFTDDSSSTVTSEVASSLNELLTQKSIPQLTSSEQISLASVIESVATVSTHSRSIDSNASRFLLFWRSSLLRSHQQSSPPPALPWREVVFAYHSTSQDILVSLILSSHNNTLTWPLARQSRLFTFTTSRTTLLEQFEALAKSAYTLSDPRNPVDCSLHYLALRKKAVLVNLWRMATWSREQGATMKLLRQDFGEARWKTAAKKNAYALMGKRRFEYAAAFFLLADDLGSALGVIGNQLEDLELAIAVGRVYGGDECPEVRDLVRKQVLKEAVRKGDRWMATWGFWFLGEKGNAVRALISPLEKLVEDMGEFDETEGASLRAKSFLNDDPALVILYEQLRAKSLQTLKGALMVDGREEWRFLVRTAGLLKRMGCDLLALDLVRNWEFLQTEQGKQEEEEGKESIGELPPSPSTTREMDPRKLLRRRSSLVVDDLDQPRKPKVEKVASMLDDFGFKDDYGSSKEQKKFPSMLDNFGMSDSTKQTTAEPPKMRSMLDDFGFNDSSSRTTAETTKPRSMLDDFGFNEGGPVRKKAEARVPSMLDGFEEPKQQVKAPSMLDAFEEPEKQGKKVPSMLDAFDGPTDTQKPKEDDIDQVRQDKDDATPKKVEEKKPTTFKEPDANSILDSFGF